MPACSATHLRKDGGGGTQDGEASFSTAGRHNEVIRVAAVRPGLCLSQLSTQVALQSS